MCKMTGMNDDQDCRVNDKEFRYAGFLMDDVNDVVDDVNEVQNSWKRCAMIDEMLLMIG
jgi:hypothetical protein